MIKEEKLTIEGLETNYKIAGSGFPFLILHGWGGSSDSWKKVIENLSRDFLIVCPDIPGFGKSKTPLKPWSLDDFVNWFKIFTEKLNFNQFFLLAHSFGARVAIKFSFFYPEKIKVLILCNPAGIKQKWGLKEKFIFFIALIGGAIFSPRILRRFKEKARNLFYIFLRNRDYAKAKGTMRETMKKVINEDLSAILEKIKVKTLILWGEKDKILPLKFAFLMKGKIQNSMLKILPNVAHSPHLEDPENLTKSIYEFILPF